MSESELPIELSVDDIMIALTEYDRKFLRTGVRAALARRDEIIPPLVKVLENTLADPEGAFECEDFDVLVPAILLLGHFRAAQAHLVIVGLASLPGELTYELFDDVVTEDLGSILQRTCNGSFEAIKGLVRNREADAYCRTAAAEAITHGVVEGMLSREEALAFLGDVLDEGKEGDDDVLCSNIVWCLNDLGPEESMDRIEKAYAKDLIDTDYVDLDESRAAQADGTEKCLSRLKKNMGSRSLDDIYARLTRHDCFAEADQAHEQRLESALNVSLPGARKMAKEKKAKRKAAKAARKKNRRKK